MLKFRKAGLPGSARSRTALVFFVLFAALTFPLYDIARFAIPSADDFVLGRNLLTFLSESWNPLHWLGSILSYTWNNYCSFQGTFGAFFVSLLLPINHSTQNYFLLPIFLLTVFFVGLYVCLRNVLYFFRTRTSNVVILFTIVATVCVQMMPSPVEGFYWWSGALLYTGFFAFGLLGVAWLFRLLREKPTVKKLWQYLLLAAFLFLTGGGGYPSAMAVTAVLGFTFLYVLLDRRDRLVLVLPMFLASAAGLACNALAPGNFIRLQTLGELGVSYKGSLLSTLNFSFRLGFQFCREWFAPALALAVVLALPVLYDGLRSSRREFRWPLLFTVCTMCAYCSTYAPVVYTYGWTGPDRYLNINFFSFVLFVFANEAYYVGWLCAKLRRTLPDEAQRDALYRNFTAQMKRYAPGVAAGAAMALAVLLGQNFYTDDTIPAQREMYTTESAVRSLKTGEAQQYRYEYRQRLQVLLDDTVTEVSFEPFSCKPALLYFDDITQDPNDWRNRNLAAWFGKDSVELRT